MTLREMIAFLERENSEQRVPYGFARPHSYRGIYSELAVEPESDTTVGEMLAALRGALNATFTGWKGGEFKMHNCVNVYLANVGEWGEQIGPALLTFMLGRTPTTEEEGRG